MSQSVLKHLDAVQDIAMRHDNDDLEHAVVGAREAFEALCDEHEAQLADLRQRLTDAEAKLEIAAKLALTPTRCKLPDERKAITHKMEIDKTEGYITVGEYDNGRPGELFLTIDHAGTKLRGMTYAVSILTSLLFQYGVPLSVIAEKFIGSHFEPEGRTKHPDIRYALSILDYAYRWLLIRYEPETYFARFPKVKVEPEATMPAETSVGWNWNVEAKP